VSDPVLSIRDVTKRFGGLTAVRKVSLDIGAGEVVALLGDNGAGKSTLIKCVSGVYQPSDGEMFLDGKRVQFAKPIDARGVGIETIYQDLALANNLDVPANIFLGRELKHRYFGGLIKTLDDRAMLREAAGSLEALDIRFPSLTQPIESLSGGQRQAVAIARTHLARAKIVLMDEPTAAISVRQVAEVLDLLRRLRDQGMAVVLISHRMPDVFGVADRIVVLRRGHKVADKPIADSSPEEVTGLITGAIRVA
jgi:ABC-type sugar transport system ATPase subunit